MGNLVRALWVHESYNQYTAMADCGLLTMRAVVGRWGEITISLDKGREAMTAANASGLAHSYE